MSQSAAVLFVGEVMAVRAPRSGFAGSPESAAEGIVEVDFFVDQAVRGPARGSTYTLREWAGLWTGGTERYRVGQRLLMLLRAPDTAGFSSPVHGPEGAIPLRGSGQPPGPDDGPSTASQWMVDVRWLQAQTLRNEIHPGVPGRGPIPIRGRSRSRSETSTLSQPLPLQSEEPPLVHALPGPWVEPEITAARTEILSHVLTLCADSTGPQNASR